jgi:hypothetical protein
MIATIPAAARVRTALLVLSLGLAAAGCTVSGGSEADVALAQAKARADWKLALEWEGTEIAYALEAMDIFIFDTDDPERYPETFEMRGDGVTLVGTLPVEAQVGYGEELDRLIGKTVPIVVRGGDPHDEKDSSIRLAGMRVPVSGGSITFHKVTGKWAGQDGDRTVWGTLRVDVAGADGTRTLEGAFAVHVISWG